MSASATDDGPRHYRASVDLHYSPDDDGWYAQDYTRRRVSTDIYCSEADLRAALDGGYLVWEDE